MPIICLILDDHTMLTVDTAALPPVNRWPPADVPPEERAVEHALTLLTARLLDQP